MTMYILNAPVLTDYGIYSFKKLSIEEARKILKENEFVSAVGHEATARVLSSLLNVEIPTNRIEVRMKKGDRAIVFRLLRRVEEGAVLDEKTLLRIPFDLGLLERLE